MNRYVKDILTNTSPSIEQVTIEPDGNWHVPTPKTTEERRSSASAPRDTSFIGDDDLMIAQPNAPSSSRATATPNRFNYGASLGGSSIAGSRETSLMPGSATSRSGTKRAAPETIDLTLSDDDEPPPRPAKRQNVGSENPAPYSAGEYSY
jgi:E3 SUMO-protein ligase PIAS1